MSQVIENELVTEVSVESVLLDADLFVKYKSPDKAFSLLRDSIKRSPRSIPLREKLREVCIAHKNATEAARQCLALVSLYIGREDFDIAYDRLQEAKLLDPDFERDACPRRRFLEDHGEYLAAERRWIALTLLEGPAEIENVPQIVDPDLIEVEKMSDGAHSERARHAVSIMPMDSAT